VQTEHRFAYVNPAFVRLLGGTSPADLLGQPVLDRFHPDERARTSERIRRLSEERQPVELIEESVVTLAGERVPVLVSAVPLHYEGRDGALVFARDIRALKQAEARVDHLNRVLRAIRDVDQLIVRENDPARLIGSACHVLIRHRSYRGALIVLADGQGRAESYAQAGLDAVLGLLAEKLDRGELPPCCEQARHSEGVYVKAAGDAACATCAIQADCRGAGVMSVRLAHGGRTHGYLAVVGDASVTGDREERELLHELAGDLGHALATIAAHAAQARLQVQLAQAQKMESVGRLAGGVAHDFNNLLMGIMNYVELCRDRIPPDHRVREYLDEIMQDAQRSADLVRQLLAFARKQTIAPKVMDLNDAVAGTLRMLRRLLGEDIDLVWVPGPEPAVVKLDPSQLGQVLANLTVNARDAIAGVGRLTIECRNITIDPAYCAEHLGATPGPYAVLTVSDTGCGMDEETLSHLFEPFFTTKEVGEGTGLGLATVYGVARQNGGFIEVSSEPQQGTTFRIYLPRHLAGTAAEPAARPPGARRPGGAETILLAEDERSVRVTLQRFLAALGYTVLAAPSAEEALRLAAAHPGTIHLLVTDVVMPGMSGHDLAARLASARPGIKRLYISGYTSNAIAHRGVLDQDVHFLPKPFTRDELAQTVRDVLDE
jgi:PAS domain S-box-containing protein